MSIYCRAMLDFILQRFAARGSSPRSIHLLSN